MPAWAPLLLNQKAGASPVSQHPQNTSKLFDQDFLPSDLCVVMEGPIWIRSPLLSGAIIGGSASNATRVAQSDGAFAGAEGTRRGGGEGGGR